MRNTFLGQDLCVPAIKVHVLRLKILAKFPIKAPLLLGLIKISPTKKSIKICGTICYMKGNPNWHTHYYFYSMLRIKSFLAFTHQTFKTSPTSLHNIIFTPTIWLFLMQTQKLKHAMNFFKWEREKWKIEYLRAVSSECTKKSVFYDFF